VSQKQPGEDIFLLDLEVAMERCRRGSREDTQPLVSSQATKKEKAEFGCCWRLAYRMNPRRARKCIEEGLTLAKEGRLEKFLSAAVFAKGGKGIWEIFGGEDISKEAADAAVAARQQKAAAATAART
jgi:hypothetical protein